ncbi:MAG: DASS family sodium-coupled anion symporter [Patescibacteria group bacterium]
MKLLNIIKENKGIILAAIVAIVIILLPTPKPFWFGGKMIVLSQQAQIMLALLGALVIIFVTEALPIGATVFIVYVWAVFFGLGEPKDIVKVFSHDAAWFLIGALMIAEVLIKYNLHKRILLGILKVVGSKVRNIVFGIVTFCALTASFIADHTIAAMMIPVVLAIVSLSGGYKRVPKLTHLLLFSVAYGVAIGGLATPSGGGRNVVMIGFLHDYFNVSINYGTWMLMGLPVTLILIPILVFWLLLIFKPEVKDLSEVIDKIKREVRMQSMSYKEWSTAIIFVIIVTLFIFNGHLGLGVIALFGALLFLIFRLADWGDYQKINWGIGLLYFGAVGLGSLLHSTGAAVWLAANIVSTVGSWFHLTEGLRLVALSVISTTVFTQIMADGPTVASLGPVFLEMAKLTVVDPVILGVSVAMASAFAFALLIGHPANAIIYGSGYLKAKDFIKAGLAMSVISVIVLLLVINFWWKFIGIGIDGLH